MAFQRRDGQVIAVVPVLDTNAYATGDAISTVQTLLNVSEDNKGVSILRNVVVLDAANQKAAIDLLFFNADPGAMGADNAALDISTAQLALLVAQVSIASADYTTLKLNTNAQATKSLEIILPCAAKGKNLYMQIVSRGTPTYLASSLTIKLSMEKL